jgi:hypothetical protein
MRALAYARQNGFVLAVFETVFQVQKLLHLWMLFVVCSSPKLAQDE